jgi:hypothetical protein
VLACDYDGTIATDGVVDAETVAALERVTKSGRRLVLVTGRELDSLLAVFPAIEVFDWVVAENGGLLYRPATREEVPLAAEPSAPLVARLRENGVHPLSIGRSIVATWEPNETTVIEAIRELGLELQVIFNKGAVMILPSGVNKRTGLEAALGKLGLSLHNAVGAGDAENDHAFLSVCECGVAVANALPALKDTADWVTKSPRGAGVRELIDRLLEDDLQSLAPRLFRHQVALGATDNGEEVRLEPYGHVVLVAGRSGSGKSSAATSLLERLVENKYQACIIDPEGDYEGFEPAITSGTPEQAPDLEQVMNVLARPENQSVVNLLGVPLDDRPAFFFKLFARLQEQRGAVSRPHWLVVDEAHHVLGEGFEPAKRALPEQLESLLLITVHPEAIAKALLERVDVVLAAGPEAKETLEAFARARGHELGPIPEHPQQPGQALLWEPARGGPRLLNLVPGRARHQRHRRKYARGELGPDKSFYFRGAENKLNLRAQNMVLFNQIAGGVDDDTWLFHLRGGDYSRWIREAIKDEALADEVTAIEADDGLSAAKSRARIRALIEERYTLPA